MEYADEGRFEGKKAVEAVLDIDVYKRQVQTNKGVQEAKLKGINSWVAVASLTAV